MGKEDIIRMIQAAVRPNDEFEMTEEIEEAINSYPNQMELVAPILDIIAHNPLTDFGMPGELVHFVEQFYGQGYEELLMASVKESPTAHNIWMLHRCFNDENGKLHDEYGKLAKSLLERDDVSESMKEEIRSYDW